MFVQSFFSLISKKKDMTWREGGGSTSFLYRSGWSESSIWLKSHYGKYDPESLPVPDFKDKDKELCTKKGPMNKEKVFLDHQGKRDMRYTKIKYSVEHFLQHHHHCVSLFLCANVLCVCVCVCVCHLWNPIGQLWYSIFNRYKWHKEHKHTIYSFYFTQKVPHSSNTSK